MFCLYPCFLRVQIEDLCKLIQFLEILHRFSPFPCVPKWFIGISMAKWQTECIFHLTCPKSIEVTTGTRSKSRETLVTIMTCSESAKWLKLLALQLVKMNVVIILTFCCFPCLKLMYAIFYQIFIFSPNDSPLKTMKNAFCFIYKALFVLKIFKFLWFFPFFSTPSRFKRTNGSGIIYDIMKWLA